MEFQAADEANDLLQNGIYVETSKGLICMSLNDAIASNLNLSAEDLKTLATELILQQNVSKETVENPIVLQSVEGNGTNLATANIMQPTVVTVTTLTPKLVSLVPFSGDSESQPNTDINSSSETNLNSCVSDSDASSVIINSEASKVNAKDPIKSISDEVTKPPIKRRGGWPKGRKRKPELLHLPPKAPATGYNLYLNEQRKLFKNSTLAFHEVTKLIGNKWSSLSLDEKKPYLEKAEEEKRRYREELRLYRQSGAYQLYLAKKRRKRAQYNGFSESDMDATDEIDEEDNEELYCRTCDQWFHNLHNKREHLQGRQHLQAVAGDMTKELGSDYDTDYMGNTSAVSLSTSLDESSMDGLLLRGESASKSSSVGESITNLLTAVAKREKEVTSLKSNLEQAIATHDALYSQLCSLRERENKLKNDLLILKEQEKDMEMKVYQLWQVPSWFIMNLDCVRRDTGDAVN